MEQKTAFSTAFYGDYEYEKYITTPENLRKTIDTFGVAIIPNVLNDEECDNMVSGIWEFFEHITQNWDIPIQRNNKDTWREFSKLYPKHSMLHQQWGVGQCQASWNVRQNEKVVNIFSEFWNTPAKDMLVSFDGLSFHPPPEKTKRGWYRKSWYHTDQSYHRSDFECIQSWVSGFDVEDGDATLTFYEKSNQFHGEFSDHFKMKDKKGTKVDWYKLSKDEEQFYINKGCSKKFIKCPRGSLVFWDSRTIHCGCEAKRGRENEKFRAVIYLCYKPRQMATKANIKKKQKAFQTLRTCNHWPCKGKYFPLKPQTYGGPIPEVTPIELPILTKLGNSLAGF